MTNWIIKNFTKHEILVLTWAQELPFFGLLFFTSLWVWFIPPVLLTTPIFVLEHSEWPVASVIGYILHALVVLVALLVVAPWCFRWFFIIGGLLRGKTKMANKKMEELERRLAKLTASE
jgi:hypothetical protein